MSTVKKQISGKRSIENEPLFCDACDEQSLDISVMQAEDIVFGIFFNLQKGYSPQLSKIS